jgi:hypothetical protein
MANDEYYVAEHLYLKGDYASALSHFQKVRTLLDQQLSEGALENNSRAGLLIQLTLSTVAIIVMTVSVFLFMKKARA